MGVLPPNLAVTLLEKMTCLPPQGSLSRDDSKSRVISHRGLQQTLGGHDLCFWPEKNSLCL